MSHNGLPAQPQWTRRMETVEVLRHGPASFEAERARHDTAAIETIRDGAVLLAIIIRRTHSPNGISFVTPPDYSLQVGEMTRDTGYEISPHVHLPIHRDTVG